MLKKIDLKMFLLLKICYFVTMLFVGFFILVFKMCAFPHIIFSLSDDVIVKH